MLAPSKKFVSQAKTDKATKQAAVHVKRIIENSKLPSPTKKRTRAPVVTDTGVSMYRQFKEIGLPDMKRKRVKKN